MTKEEKIKEGWAECDVPMSNVAPTAEGWKRVKRGAFEHLRNGGKFDYITWSIDEMSIRPASLRGVENNNGWTKIESQSDIPEYDQSSFKMYYFTTYGMYEHTDYKKWRSSLPEAVVITHYRIEPIFKPKLPIY